ncbi:hypothetical protein AKJ09_07163 [Labilithrix luteola]|uniref:Uncharacterized protein n=1 Tax=Labilithrix luteola TaxID=1391654 RepID=A0A0K1Q514_9BACT|nr:copper-binding protein [Labilithrix luteola]AKV00500.1 hypothetical protein AKJ09_07163 [Labilithrix luteola]
MRSIAKVARFVVPVVLLAAAVAVGTRVWTSDAYACGAETYSTRGVVKSFGDGRRYVNIAHDKIDGYMAAMTMSFEPRTPEQLQGIDVGDRVSFTFAATEDGRRVLTVIKKD